MYIVQFVCEIVKVWLFNLFVFYLCICVYVYMILTS
uniref:Uncharacterized protein n=1 Tax=Anguilla anguilla TaxID=7936 RepID=A0A0E9QSI5_ANGAN